MLWGGGGWLWHCHHALDKNGFPLHSGRCSLLTVCVCVCEHTCAHMSACMCACEYTRVCARVSTQCMHVCTREYMRVSTHMCVYM